MSRELKMCWKNQDGKGHFNTIYSSKILIDRNNLITGFLVQFRATGRRSNESIELQPLHLHKGPKGVLRRMPRVRSDEIHETNADPQPQPQPIPEKEKTPSPIGAGLPLLQRLRLLKEKQVSWIYNAFSYFIYSLLNWIDFLCFLFRNFFHAITFGFHKNHADWRRRIIFTKNLAQTSFAVVFMFKMKIVCRLCSWKWRILNRFVSFFCFPNPMCLFFCIFIRLSISTSMMAKCSEESKCCTYSKNCLCYKI